MNTPRFKPLFPHALLAASSDERIAYFADVIVEHPHFSDLLNEIFWAINPYSNNRIFLLVGPTGMGKSALLRKLVEKVTDAATKAGLVGPETVPAFWLRPGAPETGSFIFSKLYEQALVCMKAPLVDASRDTLTVRPSAREEIQRLLLESTARKDRDGMRTRCVANLDWRGVRLWGIEEAKVLFMTGRSQTKERRKKTIEDIADRLKLLIESVKTTLLLTGGFDFYDLSLVTGQLARRCQVFYFEPYTEQTIAGFQKGFIGLISHIPAKHTIQASDGPAFLRRCDGAIGRVRDVLMKALHTHLTRGVAFDMALVEQCFWQADQEAVMKHESEAGDMHMKAARTGTPSRGGAGSEEAQHNPVRRASATPTNAPARKVGEARPSHNKGASEHW